MIVYIHRRAKFFCPDHELTSPEFGLGDTIMEYYEGKFVRLNNNQITFWQNNPGCTPQEAFYMRLFSEEIVEEETEFIGSGSVI